MISSSLPCAPLFNGTQSTQIGTPAADLPCPDPLHILSRDSLRRALQKPIISRPEPAILTKEQTATPQILAASVVLSATGAAGLVAYIVREHMQAKIVAARALRAAHPHAIR